MEIEDNKDKSRTRKDYLDIARGGGILLVLISHSDFPILMFFAKGFFIPLFFVISGYLSTNSYDFGDYVMKKVKKLIKPYFIFNFLILLLFFDFSRNSLWGVAYSRYCLFPIKETKNIYLLPDLNSPTWFLTSMFLGSVFFAILKKYPFLLIPYLVITCVFSYLPILLPWSLDTAFLMASFMYMGYVFQMYEGKILKWKYIPIFVFVYFLVLYINGNINLSIRLYGYSPILVFIAGCLGSFVFIKLSILMENLSIMRIMKIIGKHSLTIFAMQMPFLLWGKQIFSFVSVNMVNGAPKLLLSALFQITIALIGGCY